MKRTTGFVITACCFIAYLFSTSFASAADLTVGRLSCEYLDDPVGIDSVAPRLSWWLCSEKRGQVQTAYQILVASNVERLAADEGDLWDSGRVKSDQATHVEYDGKPLESHQRCYWKVRAWDKNGQPSKWSKPGVWTMGMVDPADWQAEWIAAKAKGKSPMASGNGYHARETKKIDDVKWVQVDLGSSMPIDSVQLMPCLPVDLPIPGFGFPVRFRIEADNDPTFSKPTVIADYTTADVVNPKAKLQTFPANNLRARYVRVTATKLWQRPDGVYCFALAEMGVISNGKNVAVNAKVTAADAVEIPSLWTKVRLTDGWWPCDDKQSDTEFAAIMMRKSFNADKKIVRATVSICGLGYNELWLNGTRVGDRKLDPAFTDYSKRALYTTYDITDAVQKGENVIAVLLGNGWYRLPAPDLFGFQNAPWTATPRLLLNLRLDMADGTSKNIVSDGTWKWSTGEITFQSIRGGETIDHRQSKPGWQNLDYDDSAWNHAVKVAAPQGKLVAEMLPPIKTDGEVQAIELTEPKPGVYVLKLAENIAGWARLTVPGSPGQKITMTSFEIRNQQGLQDPRHRSHTNGRYQTEEFILKGEGREVFEPRFCYHGFQYVQLEGMTAPPKLEDLVGVRVHTLPDKAGEFSCSNDRLNLLQKIFKRTYLNNLHSIPTDCPQREKMGWLDDGCVTEWFAFHNYESAQFYTKWFHDMIDSQDPNGHVPDIVPTCGWGKSGPNGSPGNMADPWWGGAIVMTPWNLYEHYGDRRVLENGFEAMKAYVDYLTSQSKDNLVEWGLGDWLDESAGGGGRRVPVVQTSTAAYFHFTNIVSQAATVLGRTKDAQKYAALADTIRQTFNAKFMTPETGLFAADSQTAQALPLAINLVPEDKRPLVSQRLVENIVDTRKGHVSSGIVGTLYVFQALMEMGRDDLAYEMLTQESYPGWLNMINGGETTVWEAWNGAASHDHPAFTCVGFWFYQGLAGIRPDRSEPGFKKIIIKPALVGDVTWAKATYDSMHGPITSDWKIVNGKFHLNISIPANTTATVYLPAKSINTITESGHPLSKADSVKVLHMAPPTAVLTIGSGTYQFVSDKP